jgi:peptidoglycan/LPS O-acetylase OafA/YrhL
VGQYVAGVAPIVALYEALGVPIAATCGDGAQTAWPAGAVLTMAALVALALAVAAATVYTAAMASTPAAASRTQGALAACARRSSLTVTLPPLLSAAPRRHKRAGLADLGAMDGVRALSTACVVLGHSALFILTLGPGYINTAAVTASVFSAAGQVIPSAEFAVDSFFLLSGCLGAYLLAREVAAALPEWAANAPPGHSDAALLLRFVRRAPGGARGERLLSGSDDGDGEEAAGAATLPPAQPSLRRTASKLVPLYASMVVHRFLRLALPLFAMLCVLYYLMPLAGSGPLWFKYDAITQPCSGGYFWLTALLSFDVDTTTQCAGWAWYLAVDFQLYATVLPLLVFVYGWRPPAGWIALAATLALSLAVSVWVVVDKSLASTVDAGGQQEALGLTGDQFTFFYTRPWTRAPAFLCGIALGFALLSYERVLAAAPAKGSAHGGASKDVDGEGASAGGSGDGDGVIAACVRTLAGLLPLKPAPLTAEAGSAPVRVDWVATAAHAAALAMLGGLWYAPAVNYAGALGSTPPGGWSRAGLQAYTALSRPAWAAALAVVLYLCATGRGGALHSALAHPVWSPYVRISYCAYLLHPLVLFYVNFSATTQVRFSPVSLAVLHVANLVGVCAAAVAMHVAVEAPIAAAERVLMDAVARRLRGVRGGGAGKEASG